ncbi:MAG: hypothetical protein AAFR73_12055 [Pseudomonadota bacterium]
MNAPSKVRNPNSNCLDGFQCPKCESFGPFEIEIAGMIEVHDDGFGEMFSSQWDDDSICICSHCWHPATVKHFQKGGA